MSLSIALDIALMGAVVMVAIRAVHTARLFDAVVLYIMFGLLLALVWVRLEAPDLALAEAAIGAGITGALLLDASGQLGSGVTVRGKLRGLGRVGAMLATGGFALTLIAAVRSLAVSRPSLRTVVLDRLADSGVEHPVTAVLLNFRGYDTWLEVAVLLLAATGVLALRGSAAFQAPARSRQVEPISRGAAYQLVPFAVLAGGYLLWSGSHAPGGAFQAGAVLGAAGILLWLVGSPPLRLFDRRVLHVALTAGFFGFLALGLLGLASGGALLEYPRGTAGLGILFVEATVTLSIATTLVLLFAAARPRDLPPPVE